MKTHSRILPALLGFASLLVNTAGSVFAAPVDSLRVMSYNIWGSGFGALQPLSQTAAVITAAGADVVGFQESGASVDDIANMLGFNWHFFNSDLSIISRYPITPLAGTGLRGRGAKLTLSPGQEVYVFDAHLEPFPYQPYDIRDGLVTTEAQAIASAQSARGEHHDPAEQYVGRSCDRAACVSGRRFQRALPPRLDSRSGRCGFEL